MKIAPYKNIVFVVGWTGNGIQVWDNFQQRIARSDKININRIKDARLRNTFESVSDFFLLLFSLLQFNWLLCVPFRCHSRWRVCIFKNLDCMRFHCIANNFHFDLTRRSEQRLYIFGISAYSLYRDNMHQLLRFGRKIAAEKINLRDTIHCIAIGSNKTKTSIFTKKLPGAGLCTDYWRYEMVL